MQGSKWHIFYFTGEKFRVSRKLRNHKAAEKWAKHRHITIKPFGLAIKLEKKEGLILSEIR
jgi:hypothetical protein